MEELASLLWINEHHSSGSYDIIIVDCAPTAETLRLLTFPEVGALVAGENPAFGAPGRQGGAPRSCAR